MQDLSLYFCSVPTPFILEGVQFDRRTVIGQGGEATIYRGKMGHQDVAIREVFLTPQQRQSSLGRHVHREAITHSQLNHSNIIPFLGIYYEGPDTLPLTIVPYMEIGSLQDSIANGSITSNDFKGMAIGISRGIAYLHSRRPPVIHGDLHPGNILLNKYSNPYLCDFGLSRIRHEVTRTRTMQREGGRIRFLAPELSSSLEEKFRTTPESDVFSLAMTLLNIWTGDMPFAEIRSEWQVAAKVAKGERPSQPTVTLLTREADIVFWELMQQMWAKKPNKRPTSNSVVSRLERVLNS
ncbi:kinase-like protein [Clavulina sp. PMI_390]|nr:kinase-like protein [Clavulina sp. PMI_390]